MLAGNTWRRRDVEPARCAPHAPSARQMTRLTSCPLCRFRQLMDRASAFPAPVPAACACAGWRAMPPPRVPVALRAFPEPGERRQGAGKASVCCPWGIGMSAWHGRQPRIGPQGVPELGGREAGLRRPWREGYIVRPVFGRRRCCSSVVEHPLGKGEVESSIPSSSTSKSPDFPYCNSIRVVRGCSHRPPPGCGTAVRRSACPRRSPETSSDSVLAAAATACASATLASDHCDGETFMPPNFALQA
jgi:hypothetical protein